MYTTELGIVSLTNNQSSRLKDLWGSCDGAVKGFGYYHGEQRLTVTTDRELTEEEKVALIAQLQALPDIAIPQKTEKERLLEVLGLKEEDIITLKETTAKKEAK